MFLCHIIQGRGTKTCMRRRANSKDLSYNSFDKDTFWPDKIHLLDPSTHFYHPIFSIRSNNSCCTPRYRKHELKNIYAVCVLPSFAISPLPGSCVSFAASAVVLSKAVLSFVNRQHSDFQVV